MLKLLKYYSLCILAIPCLAIAHSSNIHTLYTHYYPAAESIYKKMTLDERLGQLILPSYTLLASGLEKSCKHVLTMPSPPDETVVRACGLDQIARYHLGAVLSGGGPYYNTPTLAHWRHLNQLAMQQHRLGNSHDPLLLTGNDAVHLNMHVQGAVFAPHNIGLGETHDPLLVQKLESLSAEDSLISGFNWIYAPTVAVAHDSRWGRTYECFGNNPSIVRLMAKPYVKGLQQIKNHHITGVLATAKHFIGDGATKFGLDEGNVTQANDFASFWRDNGAGYEAAIEANVGSIMVSYSAIEGQRMHFGGKWHLINQLKHAGIRGQNRKLYSFDGFVVSDWNGATRAAYFYNQQHGTTLTLPEILAKSINAGIDMLMFGPSDPISLFNHQDTTRYYTKLNQIMDALKSAYQRKLFTEKRLKEAVIRILAVKLAMKPKSLSLGDYPRLQEQERHLALRAAKASLLMVKNTHHVLPLSIKTIHHVIFIGKTNHLGLQNGGWTINWQGQEGDIYFRGKDKLHSGAITLEEAVKKRLHGYAVQYAYVQPNKPLNIRQEDAKNALAIVVVAEPPYAEYMGDIANSTERDDWYQYGATDKVNAYLGLPQRNSLTLTLPKNEVDVIRQLHKIGVPVVTVIYSGRRMNFSFAESSNAIIAAFLPGTLGGQAVSDAIFTIKPSENKKQSH